MCVCVCVCVSLHKVERHLSSGIHYLFQKWKTCGLHENLRLPLLNKFVPTCFDLLPREKNVGYILFNS